jgi:hypothetical protein
MKRLVWGAKGNKQTCIAQGFLGQFALAGPFYNGALAHYFLLVIRGGMKDREIARKYELWWHLLAIVWPLGTAVAALWLDLYAFIYLGCWIGQTPLGCQSDDEIECVRGENAFLYGWFFMGVPLFILNTFIMYCMVQIYRYIQRIAQCQEQYEFERNNQNLRSSTVLRTSTPSTLDVSNPSANSTRRTSLKVSNSNRRNSLDLTSTRRETAIQSFLYVGAFIITHIWSVFLFWSVSLFDVTPPPFALVLIQNTAWPLQGFFNVFIFLRPRISSLRRRHSELSYARLVYYATFRYDEWNARGSSTTNEPRSSNRAVVFQTSNHSQTAHDISSSHHSATAPMTHMSDSSDADNNEPAHSDRIEDRQHNSDPTAPHSSIVDE